MNSLTYVGRAAALVLATVLYATAPATANEEHPHDHASHGSTEPRHVSGPEKAPPVKTNVPEPLAWLGKLHPLVTHFPIALLSAAALAELLFIRTRNARYRHTVAFCVRLGAAAALVAVPLGWFFAGFRVFDAEWVMTAHRWTGTVLGILAVTLLVLLDRDGASERRRARFRIVLFATAGLVGVTGFLGGSLIYGLDHYAW